ncbi:MAG: hypothetical protein CMJ42_23075 [Phyllobacteriaceae bacterium]|nr:hypothetical protein [Phyllobacteriaceae bacterium]MBA89232.1 hypothetical protein [Phyllobacteriaceae bacterium]
MDVLNFLYWLVTLVIRAFYKSGIGLVRFIRWAFRKRPTTFGSAEWAGLGKLVRAGALGNKGLIVGKAWGRLLRFNGDGAVLVAAPMGSGKGVGIVIPNLLDHPGAVICTDPKGENEARTSDYRATLGPVFRLNAIHPERSDSFNPLDMIRLKTATEFDDALMLADLLVVPESADSYWDTAAKNTLAAAIMYVMRTRQPAERTLATVGALVDDAGEMLRDTFTRMAEWPEQSIASLGRTALQRMDNDEFLSVMSNTSKALKIWASDRIAGRLSMQSSFNLMDVHTTPMTVYVMVPEELLGVYGPYLRVIMGCTMAALVRGKGLARPKAKPLVLLDECQALGRLDALERSVGYLREYAHLMLIFQDLGRMRALYGEDGADSFVAASGAQVLFGVNDLRTARDMAEILGHKTVQTRSEGQSQANTDLLRRQDQAGISEAGRLLLDASEILRLPHNRAIVRMNTVRAPIKARKVRYFKENRWAGLWKDWRDGADAAAPVDFDEPFAPHGIAQATDASGQADTPGHPAIPSQAHQSDRSGRPPVSGGA